MVDYFPKKHEENFIYELLNDNVLYIYFICKRHTLNSEEVIRTMMKSLYSDDHRLPDEWIKNVPKAGKKLSILNQMLVYVVQEYTKKSLVQSLQPVIDDFCHLLRVQEYLKSRDYYCWHYLFHPSSEGVGFKGGVKTRINFWWEKYRAMFERFMQETGKKRSIVQEYSTYLAQYSVDIISPSDYAVMAIINKYIEIG